MGDLLLSVSVHCISRLLFLRNRLRRSRPVPTVEALRACRPEPQQIVSGGRLIDGMLVVPVDSAPAAAVLLCHGIGEVVEDWLAAQVLLASAGVASLVFDYTGYGRSRGGLSVLRAEADATAAYTHLQRALPALRPALFGYSMGSGIAASVAAALDAPLLILGGSFASLREAADCLGVPASLAARLPDVWRTRDALARLRTPVLLLHGEDDELFPPDVADDLARCCDPQCAAVRFSGCAHDTPIFGPHPPFWDAVITAILSPAGLPRTHNGRVDRVAT